MIRNIFYSRLVVVCANSTLSREVARLVAG
jgi:hypothetical protein